MHPPVTAHFFSPSPPPSPPRCASRRTFPFGGICSCPASTRCFVIIETTGLGTHETRVKDDNAGDGIRTPPSFTLPYWRRLMLWSPLLTVLLPLVHRSHLGCWSYKDIAHECPTREALPLPSVHMHAIHCLVGRPVGVGLPVAMEGRHHVGGRLGAGTGVGRNRS